MPHAVAATPARATFVARRVLRFSDCDPAGIVFFPNYFVLLNGVVEDWWSHIGHPWTQTIGTRRMGTPVAHLDAQFIAPSHFGDELDFQLQVARLGRSSLHLAHRVVGANQHERLRVQQRLVCTSLETHRPMAWPDDLRAAIEHFNKEGT